MTMHSKSLERKTADAALKRAMLGREEAEAEMRRYRDEVKLMRKTVEDGKERERRVGERLETVMVSSTRPYHDGWKLHANMHVCHRKTTVAPKKHTPTHKHCGRRRRGGCAKRPSSQRAL